MAGLEGTQLGNYELVERIGSGGMAEVYRAKQLTAFGREVAVKVIRQGFSEDAMFRERFLREAQAIAKLSHPNILPLIEFGEQGDILYLVMPYAPGGTLRDLIARVNGPLALTDAVEIFTQLCDAVQYAHEQGIVHRDIKPQNVLIQRGKHLLLADFGIARDAASEQKLTTTGAGIGTVEYMAPEQAMGKSDPRSDLYSLGIVFYQMITGRVPFGGSTPFEIMMKQANEPLQPARTLNPSLPREVDGILEMALAKDPSRRFQSAGALQRAAQGLLQAGRGDLAGDDFGTRAAPAPGGQVSPNAPTRTVLGPEQMSPGRPGIPPVPGVPSRQATGGGGSFPPPPARGTGPGFGSNPGRGGSYPESQGNTSSRGGNRTSEQDRSGTYGGNQPPVGWGGKPYTSSPPPANPYQDAGTFATESPALRRPPNAYSGPPNRPVSRAPGYAPETARPANPPRRGNKWLLIVAAVLVIAVLGIGGLVFAKLHTGNNTSGGSGGNPGNGATATSAPALPPSYAFLRNYQVFISLHGQAPKQVTNIPKVGQPNSSLGAGINTDLLQSPFLFSPDGRYIACLIQIIDTPRDGFLGGNLSIIDTTTGKVKQPTEPGSSSLLFSQGGENALAWEDSQTLLIAGDPNTKHVRAYHVNSDSYTVAFSPPSGQVGSVIVRGQIAYYSDLVPISGSSNNNVVLRSFDLKAQKDQELFTLGQVSAPEGPGAAPDGYGAFDITPDGTHVIWEGFSPGGSTLGIWYSASDGSAVTQLANSIDLSIDTPFIQFSPAPLSFSPDSKKVLFSTLQNVYTFNIDGTNLKTYAYPDAQGAWLPDSSSITVAQEITTNNPPTFKTFQCAISTGGCSLFQDNAYPLYWSLS